MHFGTLWGRQKNDRGAMHVDKGSSDETEPVKLEKFVAVIPLGLDHCGHKSEV